MEDFELYEEEIIDHYNNPRNYGKVEEADIVCGEHNLSCGDEVVYYIKVKDNKIEDIKHETRGCMICLASASMLSEKVKGKELKECLKIEKEEVEEMIKIPLGVNRIKCALLPLKTLKKGIIKYLSENE